MTRQVSDHLGRVLTVPEAPRRIISLCPSQTETLFALGLGSHIVGITHFCIHPKQLVQGIEKVGGTKKVDASKVATLQPDLIIAEKEEQTPEIVDTLSAIAPVYVTEVLHRAHALQGIADMAALCGVPQGGQTLCAAIEQALAPFPLPPLGTVAYFIWRKPWMAVGTPTYIADMLTAVGLQNVLAKRTDSRYPEVSAAQLQAADPDVILLSSEPYPFAQKHIAEFEAICPRARVLLVDGEMFSWYGSRMLLAAPYLQQLHGQLRTMLSPNS